MELWKGKVALVTGASSGVGAAISKDLCRHNVIVVGMAKRLDRLEALKNEILETKRDSQFIPVQCDLTLEEEIRTAFEYITAKFGGVDILVNNAETSQETMVLQEDNLDRLKSVINTNLIAMISCTKKAFKSMSVRDVPGYIINISSAAGYVVPNMPSVMNVYPSSKFAVRALNTVLRHELNYLKKNKIRISNVSPGVVAKEIVNEDHPYQLLPEDVADVVMYFLASDPRVQVEDVIIRGVREY